MLAQARETEAPAAAGSALRVSFKNSRGLLLAGELLTPPSGGPHPVVVFAHGWGSGKASPRNRAAAEALVAEGIASFLFDFTGHGESEGTKEESTQAQQIDDLRAAISALEDFDEIDTTRLGLMGASSGALLALLLAAESQKIRALVLRSGNLDGAEDVAPRARVPTLLVVGEDDKATRVSNEALVGRLGGPRRLEVVPGGSHLFENPEALRRAITLAVDWFKRYLR
jgi:dienelactone hydrolase